MRAPILTFAFVVTTTPGLYAQHEHSPYAGMATAEGTTLTPQEIDQLRNGEGMRLALPAELNQHPGPKHVLELRDSLGLTPTQVQEIEAIRETMHADAVRKGAEIIEVENHLAGAFRTRAADPDEVDRMTQHLGSLRGQLQAIHLLAHLGTRLLLTDRQVSSYDQLRGYQPQQESLRTAHGQFTGEVKPVLYVRDVEASVPFFRDVLGFELDGYSDLRGEPYYADMLAAGLKFGLHEPTSTSHEPRVGQQRIYFRVQDLAAHRARVEARQGDPGEIVETDWMDMFIVRDPDGHEIVFAATDPAKHSIDPW